MEKFTDFEFANFPNILLSIPFGSLLRTVVEEHIFTLWIWLVLSVNKFATIG